MGRPTALTSSVSFGGLEEGGEEDKVYEKHWERKQIKLNLIVNMNIVRLQCKIYMSN